MDDPIVAATDGTHVTAAICGLATLALATVLGLSLACHAMKAPADTDRPVTIISHPPAADTALISDVAPFGLGGCTMTAAATPR
jgi:hypothetical protein